MFQLTPEVKAALSFFLTQGIKSLFLFVGVEISGFGSVVLAAVVLSILVFAEAIVVALPAPWQSVINVLLGLLATMGAHKTYKGISSGQ